jgi:hypothetical protein
VADFARKSRRPPAGFRVQDRLYSVTLTMPSRGFPCAPLRTTGAPAHVRGMAFLLALLPRLKPVRQSSRGGAERAWTLRLPPRWVRRQRDMPRGVQRSLQRVYGQRLVNAWRANGFNAQHHKGRSPATGRTTVLENTKTAASGAAIHHTRGASQALFAQCLASFVPTPRSKTRRRQCSAPCRPSTSRTEWNRTPW